MQEWVTQRVTKMWRASDPRAYTQPFNPIISKTLYPPLPSFTSFLIEKFFETLNEPLPRHLAATNYQSSYCSVNCPICLRFGSDSNASLPRYKINHLQQQQLPRGRVDKSFGSYFKRHMLGPCTHLIIYLVIAPRHNGGKSILSSSTRAVCGGY